MSNKSKRTGNSFQQDNRNRAEGRPANPQHGPRSNPGNVEAGIGHTRGHNRPGSNTGGRGRDAKD